MLLNTHTYYSLRYGTVSPKKLLKLLSDNGYDSVVLTDINTTSGCLELIREAPNYKVKPIVGVDFRNGVDQKFILIAKNGRGFKLINSYLTQILHNNNSIPDCAPDLTDVFVIYPFEKERKRQLGDNEYLGISPTDLPYIQLNNIDTSRGVILRSATFRNKKDFNAHRLLRAIDNNTLLSKLPVSEQASPEDSIIPLKALLSFYADYPSLVINTEFFLQESSIYFDFSADAEHQNQKSYTGDEEKDLKLLNQLCKKGISYRYPCPGEEIFARVEKELKTIQQMNFVSYFLMNWDIVRYARLQGYFYVGRGSGANSIVAYLLRITDVDPIELDLYFERFINLYRTSPPDFDIDFSWRDREAMTHYIFNRFDNVALVATYNTFKDRAVLRELGKVFGLPKEEIDKLTKGRFQHKDLNHISSLVIKYAKYIHGFPSHLSVHASGVLISEKSIQTFSATFMPPKGFATVQFDMHIAEDVGLYKFDILSQRGLSKIKDALDIVAYNQPDAGDIDIHDIKRFKEDEHIKVALRKAKSIGCFYVESPAMRMLLTKLQVQDYLGLVAASSVIRPGVAKSGMMQEYIKRFRNPEKRKEAHPVLAELMPETYGVMVYQEDVIKVAHYFAGLTLGEADKMRRGMSGKYRSREEFQAVKQKFFSNCIEDKGHSEELTAEVWRQTESFAGYAFAKGHSASYAVESYQCLFLKVYYPLEFLVATINNYGGFYSTELYVLEAKLFGGIIFPSCVNQSSIETVIQGRSIYLGFHLLKSFELQLGRMIVEEREVNGLFESFDDFINRIHISLEQLSILVRINAFRFTGKDKRTLMWEAHLKTSRTVSSSRKEPDLFRVSPKEYQIPSLIHTDQEDAFDQIEIIGFPLKSAFDILVDRGESVALARDLPRLIGEDVWVKGYLIHTKKTVTSNGKLMFFGTFLDEKGDWLDTVHFPIIANQYRFRGKGVYKVLGTVISEYECISIEVKYMEKMDVIEDPRYSEVRNEKKEKEVVTWNNRKDYEFNRKSSKAKE